MKIEKLSVEWFSAQLRTHVEKGFKVNVYDILYFEKKASEMHRDELNDAIWYGVDLEAGNIRKDKRFEEIVDQFIVEKKIGDADTFFNSEAGMPS